MKAKIIVNKMDEEGFNYCAWTDIIEWTLPIPVHGDSIEIEEDSPFEFSFQQEPLNGKTAADVLSNNDLKYVRKHYHLSGGEVVVKFYFGDWD